MKKNNLGTGLSLTLAFVTGVLGTYLVFMNNPKITKKYHWKCKQSRNKRK